MLIIGLTGGIASGKSTVVDRFRALGATVHDADVIARDLLQPGTPAFNETLAHFGSAIMNARGEIDRAALRALVFADPRQRALLEGILHPRVRNALLAAAQQPHESYCIFCVPLLIESGMTDLADRILVVDVSRDVQLARLCQRDGMTHAAALQILAAQASREQRLAVADDVIDNNGDVAALSRQVQELHQKYCRLSSQETP